MTVQLKEPIVDTFNEVSTVNAIVEDVKNKIDEVLRARKAQPRPPSSNADAGASVSYVLNSMGNAIAEIEEVIRKLQDMRKGLGDEATRVQRELVAYASTSQAALGSLKSIGEDLAKWQQSRNILGKEDP